VIPGSTTVVIVVAALDVLGRPLDDAIAHRLELVCAATGAREGDVVGPALLAAALAHSSSYPSRIRAGVRAGVFLNKADDEAALAAAGEVAALLRPPYAFVAAGSARSGRGVALA
jgi:probable selenium-dependent hydroxylase accessory protein YqeC